MKHEATPRFWQLYQALPASVQELADKNFQLLKNNPQPAYLRGNGSD